MKGSINELFGKLIHTMEQRLPILSAKPFVYAVYCGRIGGVLCIARRVTHIKYANTDKSSKTFAKIYYEEVLRLHTAACDRYAAL